MIVKRFYVDGDIVSEEEYLEILKETAIEYAMYLYDNNKRFKLYDIEFEEEHLNLAPEEHNLIKSLLSVVESPQWTYIERHNNGSLWLNCGGDFFMPLNSNLFTFIVKGESFGLDEILPKGEIQYDN